jgi:hypothetical protein
LRLQQRLRLLIRHNKGADPVSPEVFLSEKIEAGFPAPKFSE